MAISDYFHVTVAGAGGKTGADWANAFGLAEFLTDFSAASDGDVYFLKDGVYTLTANQDFRGVDGVAISPICLIGVKDGTTNEGADIVFSDWSRDPADKPFIDGASYFFLMGDYTCVRNMEFQSAAVRTLELGIGSLIENCKIEDDHGSSSATWCLFATAGTIRIINNEFLSANAGGIDGTGTGNKVLFNYFHDFADATNGLAVKVTSTCSTVFGNIFDTVAKTGVQVLAGLSPFVMNNTFYETDTGVDASTSVSGVYMNNIMEGNDIYGFRWTTQTDNNYFWGNHGDDTRCTDMWSNVDVSTIFQDYEVTTGDPDFDDASGGDFKIPSSSPCYGTGESITLGV